MSFEDLGNDVVLAGSGEDKSLGEFESPGRGILRSEDGGVTWNKTDMNDGQWASFAYMGNDVVLAGSMTSDLGGVWKSIDGGRTWVQSGLKSGFIQALQQITDKVAIAGKNNAKTAGDIQPIQITTDGGLKWKNILQPPATLHIFAFLKLRDGYILSGNSSTSGIGRGESNGSIWLCDSAKEKSFISLAQISDNVVLAGNGSDQNNVDAGGAKGASSGIWRSTTAGSCNSYNQTNMKKYTWKGLVGLAEGHALAGCADASADVKCSGVWKSTDNGMNWAKINNPVVNDRHIFAMETIRK